MFGDCIVERLLGKGGLGFVYLVHGSDGKRYALKTLCTNATENSPEYKQRFAQEANLMMTLHHRNLVRATATSSVRSMTTTARRSRSREPLRSRPTSR